MGLLAVDLWCGIVAFFYFYFTAVVLPCIFFLKLVAAPSEILMR
jgi:hypothetical protein